MNKETFSTEEKAAMRARVKELKLAQEGEAAITASLKKMTPADRAIGKRIHELVKEAAPQLTPKTWYGMPAYANKSGKVVIYFRDAGKFKERYSNLGFNDSAKLDSGTMWPIMYAIPKLAKSDEAKIRTLIKKATS
ncbi:MAG TPA: DUF1801 domain-containing protein [Gaiellaceae bacterium]|nr:DUF1801 domain-containing protein [Gaiellaceae bacterium]